MSLRWELTKIENAETVCFLPPDENGEKRINPVTDVLIWYTIALGMSDITAANWHLFYRRLWFYDRLNGPLLLRQEGGIPKPVTPEEVRQHVGLHTNVSPEDDETWLLRQAWGHMDLPIDNVPAYDLYTSPFTAIKRDSWNRLQRHGDADIVPGPTLYIVDGRVTHRKPKEGEYATYKNYGTRYHDSGDEAWLAVIPTVGQYGIRYRAATGDEEDMLRAYLEGEKAAGRG